MGRIGASALVHVSCLLALLAGKDIVARLAGAPCIALGGAALVRGAG